MNRTTKKLTGADAKVWVEANAKDGWLDWEAVHRTLNGQAQRSLIRAGVLTYVYKEDSATGRDGYTVVL